MNALTRMVGSAALVAALLLVPGGLTAQILVGQAVDVADSSGVAGAKVEVVTEAGVLIQTAITDEDGIFVVPVDGGIYVLRVTRIGYAPVESLPVEVGPSERVTVEIPMAVQAVELAPVLVVGRIADPRQRDLNDYFERVAATKEAGLQAVYTRADLKKLERWRFQEFMEREAPRLGYSTPSLTSQGNRCRPLVFWDGVARDVDPYMSLASLEGVEFYRGFGAPNTRFLNPAGCGVVLVWTRPLTADPRARPHSKSRLFAAVALAVAFLTVKLF